MKFYALLAVLLLVGCSRPTPISEIDSAKLRDAYSAATATRSVPGAITYAASSNGTVCSIDTAESGLVDFLPREDGQCHTEDASPFARIFRRLDAQRDETQRLERQLYALRAQMDRLNKLHADVTIDTQFPVTGAAIATKPGSIANTGTVGSITVNGRLLTPDIAIIEP